MATIVFGAIAGNWSDDTKWVGGVKPTAADDAQLVLASANCTIDANSVCRSLDCNTYTGNLTHTNNFTLSIGDGTAGTGNIALRLVSGMTYTRGGSGSAFAFISTSTTVQTVDFANKLTGSVSFNGVAGKWQLTGAHQVSNGTTVTLTNGQLDFNGQTVTWGAFDSSGTTTRVLTLGAATINLNLNAGSSCWNIGTTGLTFSGATSTINIAGGSAVKFDGGNGLTYGTINVTTSGQFRSNGTYTVGTMAITGSAVKTDSVLIYSQITVTGTFTCNGNSPINRLLVNSDTIGTGRTISAGTVVVTNTDFQDITGAGAGSWDFSARTDIGNCGGNSGITFPASVNQYYGGVNLNGSYLRCNGIASNYCSAPDSDVLDIVSDIELQVRCSLDDWTPAAISILLAKKLTTGNNRSYDIVIDTAGKLSLDISPDGTSGNLKTATSSVATGFTDGTPHWLKATYVKSSGLVQFFYADDSTSVPSSWTQLGTDQSITANTAIYAGTALLEIGSSSAGAFNLATGKFYRARVLSGVGGTVVFDADFTAQSAGTKSFTESSANGATVSLVVTGGNWSASSWTTRVPLPQDDAYLGNAYTASQTVTADMPRLGRSIDWTGATGTPAFAFSSVANSIYGSVTLVSGMTVSGTQVTTLAGRSSFTITSAGKSFTQSITMVAPTGTYTMQDSLSLSTANSVLSANGGEFNSGGFTITTPMLAVGGTLTKVLTITNSTVNLTLTGNDNLVNVNATGTTINALGSNIVLTNASSQTRNFLGGSKVYGTLTSIVAGSTGKLTITGSNSFSVINFSDASNARTLEFTAGTTTTIRDGANCKINGTNSKLMTIAPATASNFTIASANNIISNYLSISYCQVTGGKWYAQTTSTDGGNNNANVIFTDAPNVVSSPSVTGVQGLRNLQNIQRL